jgi:type I restriction enzyme S subunit
MSEVMAVPKLRFKEFEGDWSTNKIEEISIVTSGGTPSRNVSDYWNGDIPWVTTSLVDFNVINEAEEFITQVGLDNSSAKLFHKDTILMAMYGQGITRGKVAILGIDATTNQACAAIKLKNGFETKFIFQNLMNRYEEIRDLSNEGGQKNLSAGIIKEILISFPEKEEQTKIASFLSAVDEKISQLTQKHELLSQYKQGMMQKLFSQQIRFKADDGSEFEEWVDGKLGDITNIQGGFAFKSTDFGKGDTKVLRIGDIQKNIDLDRFEGITSSEIPDSRYLVYKDSIVMALSGATFGKLGKVKSGSAFINQRVATFTSKEKSINEFLYQVMLSQDFYNYIQSIPSASAQPNISNQDVINYKLNFPCLEEQTKIANFLSAIDQKIEVVAQQIEQAKTWKKGLLQQMFV